MEGPPAALECIGCRPLGVLLAVADLEGGSLVGSGKDGRRQGRARALAYEYVSRGEAAGWFEPLYRQAAGDPPAIQRADLRPNPHLVEWANRSRTMNRLPCGDSARSIRARRPISGTERAACLGARLPKRNPARGGPSNRWLLRVRLVLYLFQNSLQFYAAL